MSLINDALQRAQEQKSEADGAPVSPSPSDDPGMEILTPARRPRRGRSRTILLIAAAVLASGALAAWQLLGARGSGAAPRTAAADVARPAATPSPARPAAAPASPSPAGAAAITLTPAARAEAMEIIEKSLAAVKYYKPPVADSAALGDARGGDDSAEDWGGDGEAAQPAPPEKTPASAQPAPSPAAAKAGPGETPKSAVPAKPAAPAPVQFDASKYKVNGVLLGEENSSAVVNGRIVKLGDSLDGAKVVKITGRNVYVEIAGQVFALGA